MGTNEKSGQPAQKPEHGPDEHFAKRRKILGGLAGAPVFLTFSPHAGAQVESFARCVSNELGEPTTDLSPYTFEDIDQNGEIIKRLYSDTECQQLAAELSVVCYSSFIAGGGTPATSQCPVDPGAADTTNTPGTTNTSTP